LQWKFVKDLSIVKTKNLNLSFLILSGLMFLSFAFFVAASDDSKKHNIFLDSDQDGLTDEEERIYGTDPNNPDTDGDGYSDFVEVQAGFDPLKPAPHDRLEVTDEETKRVIAKLTENVEEDNLTNSTAQKIVDLTTSSELADEGIAMSSIQEIVNSALEEQGVEDEMSAFYTKDDIKIKKQDYAKYGEEKALVKEKEDFAEYLIAVYYIMASNSPRPITSATDMTSIMSELVMNVMTAVSVRDASSLSDARETGEKIVSQLRDVEVPETVAELHLKALNFSQYTASMGERLAPKDDDPLGDMVNLGKIMQFIGLVSDFAEELEEKFVEYDLDYDENMRAKIQGLGLVAPERDAFQSLDEIIEKKEE
jgi:hypothetical protein